MKHITTIAIIDDDDIFVLLTKKVIESANIADKVKIFENGQDAIDFFKENSTKPNLLPEIALLDLSMPIMDGWQFLEEYTLLKPKIEKKTVIYIVTSSISPEDIKKAKSIEIVSDYFIKPVTKEQLIEIVKKL